MSSSGSGPERPVRRLRRTRACGNALFDVHFDHIREASGAEVERFLAVKPKCSNPDLVTGAAVLPLLDGRAGLLSIYRYLIDETVLEVPRGFVESDETPGQTVLRELEEETGLVCSPAALVDIGCVAPDAGILEARVRCFVALKCTVGRPFVANEFGHLALNYHSRPQVEALLDGGRFCDPCTLFTLLHALRKNWF